MHDDQLAAEAEHQVEPLLTTQDVARILRRHPRTVHRWRERGSLPYLRTPGGRIMYRASTVRELIEAWEIW